MTRRPNTSDRETAFRSRLDIIVGRLIASFTPAYREGYWRYKSDPTVEIGRFVFRTVSALTTADGELSDDELWVVRTVFGEFPDDVLRNAVRRRASQGRKVLGEIPTFMDSMTRYDHLYGSHHALEGVTAIKELLELLFSHLPEPDDRAVEYANAFLGRLHGHLEDSGIPTVHTQHKEDSPGASTSIRGDDVGSINNLEPALAELDALVGLQSVKAEVSQLANLLKVRQLREAQGLPNPAISLHMVFTGNPGTGKTTVARILARILCGLGVVSRGAFVETDRSGLVAGYVGQTALKTRAVVTGALGGVLFIDEAYSLTSRGDQDFGAEAIETLLKMMEDYRSDLVVIVAGYTEHMASFVNANPGLRSRFARYIHFPDYGAHELAEIFSRLASGAGYRLAPDVTAALPARFESFVRQSNAAVLGNARFVRNLFEKALGRHANRIAAAGLKPGDELDLLTHQDLY